MFHMFLLRTQNICLIGKKLRIISFGDYTYLCLPPYNSNIQCFEIQSPFPRTLNLRDSTVYAKKSKGYKTNIMRQADVYEVYKVHNHLSDDPQVVNGTAKSLL